MTASGKGGEGSTTPGPSWEDKFRKEAIWDGKYTIVVPKGTYEVKIMQDEDASNPRTEYDNASCMLFNHSRYTLGDRELWKRLGINNGDFSSWKEVDDWLHKNAGVAVSTMVRMYDHSGITISASDKYPYNDPWDSGCIGIAYMTRAKMCEEFSVKKITPKHKIKARKLILSEIDTYDHYLRGNVHGYTVEGPECDESCSGYLGDIEDTGMLDNIVDHIKDAIEQVQEDKSKSITKQ